MNIKQIFKEEESSEILKVLGLITNIEFKVLGLITNIEEYQKIFNHV